MKAMTAAHRTLPLGSVVGVTNVKTGRKAVVRITDRGPFIAGRIIDLSLAAARDRSIIRPAINGPRPVIRTTALRPVFTLVTPTTDPKGNVRCAAVMAFML